MQGWMHQVLYELANNRKHIADMGNIVDIHSITGAAEPELPEPTFYMDPESIKSQKKTTTVEASILMTEEMGDDEYPTYQFQSNIQKSISQLTYQETEKEAYHKYYTYICSMTITHVMNVFSIPVPVKGTIGFITSTNERKLVDFQYDIDECTGESMTRLKNPHQLYVDPMFEKGTTGQNVLYTYAPIKKALFLENCHTVYNGKDYTKIDTDSATYKVLMSFGVEFERVLKEDKEYAGISSKLICLRDKDDESNAQKNGGDKKHTLDDPPVVMMETAAYEYFKKKFKSNILALVNPVDFSSSQISLDWSVIENYSTDQQAAIISTFKDQGNLIYESTDKKIYQKNISFTIEISSYAVPKSYSPDNPTTGMMILNRGRSNYSERKTTTNNQSLTFGVHPLCSNRLLSHDLNPMDPQASVPSRKAVPSARSKSKKKKSSSKKPHNPHDDEQTPDQHDMMEVKIEPSDGTSTDQDEKKKRVSGYNDESKEFPPEEQAIVDEVSNKPILEGNTQ